MKRLTLLAAPLVMTFAGAAWADPFSYTATDTPVTIVDTATVSSTLFVLIGGTIAKVEDMNVLIDITHSFDSDLRITLRHDDTGTTVLLVDQRGADGVDFDNVTLDDEAADPISVFTAPGTGQSFRPEQALAGFIGENLMGSWTLFVTDLAAGDAGSIDGFSVSGIVTPEPGTYAMFGFGALGLAGVALRRRRAAAAAAAAASVAV